jgi:hypothetical protein
MAKGPKHRLNRKQIKELFGLELIVSKGPRLRRLTADEFERAFGVRPARKLSKSERQRAHDNNELFVDMHHQYGMGSIEVFRAAAEDLHFGMLSAMSSCPEFVLAYMRKKLDPAVLERLREKKAARLRTNIRQAEVALRRLT